MSHFLVWWCVVFTESFLLNGGKHHFPYWFRQRWKRCFIEGFMLQCQLANWKDQIYDIFKCLPPDVQATIFSLWFDVWWSRLPMVIAFMAVNTWQDWEGLKQSKTPLNTAWSNSTIFSARLEWVKGARKWWEIHRFCDTCIAGVPFFSHNGSWDFGHDDDPRMKHGNPYAIVNERKDRISWISVIYWYDYEDIMKCMVSIPEHPRSWSSHVCFVDVAATNWGNSCAMLSVTQFLHIDRPILIPNLESERILYERIDTQVRILVKKDELTLEGANELQIFVKQTRLWQPLSEVSVSSTWPLRKRPYAHCHVAESRGLLVQSWLEAKMVPWQEWKVDTLCDLYETLTITQAIIYCSSLAISYFEFIYLILFYFVFS